MNIPVLQEALTGVKGAAKYLAAAATGDVVSDEVLNRRLGVHGCLGCPSRVRKKVVGAYLASDWCGQPFVESLSGARPTCGCLCAAKAMVASQQCPQGRWGKLE